MYKNVEVLKLYVPPLCGNANSFFATSYNFSFVCVHPHDIHNPFSIIFFLTQILNQTGKYPGMLNISRRSQEHLSAHEISGPNLFECQRA